MAERRFHVEERCQRCENVARYTTYDGLRLCGACVAESLGVRDADVPALIQHLSILLAVLDHQGVSAGHGSREQLREMLMGKLRMR